MPCGLRISEETLRSLARQRIDAGQLPVIVAHRVSAGYGSGECCCLCAQPVEKHHVAYEVGDSRDGGWLVFHVNCHSVWQFECASRTSSPIPHV